ncbi:MAG: hypothetical protein WCV00_04020 [Verrucomicrobiia bacterium]|jgi:hypothetical protein
MQRRKTFQIDGGRIQLLLFPRFQPALKAWKHGDKDHEEFNIRLLADGTRFALGLWHTCG